MRTRAARGTANAAVRHRRLRRLGSYESDVTRLLRELVERNPAIAEDQFEGRSLWWDRKLDLEAERRYRESAIKQRGYVYECRA